MNPRQSDDPLVAQLGEGRGDGGGAGRDRHRHGERVVDQQRGAGDERRLLAEVVLATPGRSRRRSDRRGSPAGSWCTTIAISTMTTIEIGIRYSSASAAAIGTRTWRISSVA